MVMICYFKEARVDRLSEMLWPVFMRRSCLIVGFLVVFCSLWALQLKYDELKKSMDALIASSIDSLLDRIRHTASRSVPEFNRLEALDLLEALRNVAQDVKHEKASY